MSIRTKWLASVGTMALLAGGYLAYRHLHSREQRPVSELLDFMPPEASTVLYVDLAALRQSPFLEELGALGPSPEVDRDYAEFVRETGFDYTRDLERAAVAIVVRGEESNVFAVADGRFDRSKIKEFALKKTGRQETIEGREAYSTLVSGGPKRITLTFLANNRIALTDGPNLAAYLTPRKENPAGAPWRERFTRLAGSPVFSVSAMTSESATAASRAAGLRADQLTSLARSLRWGTLAARPDGDRLRVVAEGECASEESARQLAGMVSGLVVLARAGLSDPKAQKQVGPEAITAIDEVLKGVDVSRIDRGETKAVRVVIELTPRFLQAMRRMNTQPSAR